MSKIEFNFKDIELKEIEFMPEQVYSSIKEIIEEIIKVKTKRTFSNTVQPLINAYTKNQTFIRSLHYILNFFPNNEQRNLANISNSRLTNLLIKLSQRKDLFLAFLDYEKNFYNEEKESLTHEEQRYFTLSMREFRRNGLEKEDPEIEVLNKKLNSLQNKFRKNLNAENTIFEFKKSELEGMPLSWFEPNKLSPKSTTQDKDPSYIVTLKYPDYIPAMEYVKNRSVRRQLMTAYNSRCMDKNVELFEDAIKTRSILAKKLGYKNHADFATEICVVKNSDRALDFLDNLNEKFTEKYEEEKDELIKFAQVYQDNPLKDDSIKQWDRAYYLRALKEFNLDIDMEKIKEYFPFQTVKKGMFEIYKKLLSITITKIKTDNKWHEDVELYKVHDKLTHKTFGYFYLDMYPRDGKYSHAAVFPFQDNCCLKDNPEIFGTKQYGVVAMICNFPKDSCISFNDVVTFFHEFGHIMHQLCSQTQLADFSSFNVERDFVEAPSQMLENWCYEEEALKLLSGHKDTKKPIPKDQINKLKELKNFMQGYRNKRQLVYGIYDLKVHRLNLNSDDKFDSFELWNETLNEVMGIDEIKETNQLASFGHLMGGYDAGYYGYLRAEAYASNMFLKKFKGDILNEQVGLEYRKIICEQGATKDGVDLLKEFLGEEPDDNYFLIDKGIN